MLKLAWNPAFCISKFICCFIISLYCRVYHRLFGFCDSHHFLSIFCLHLTSIAILFCQYFACILHPFCSLVLNCLWLGSWGLFDLFYRFQIFWDWVICQSAEYINRYTLRNYSYTYCSSHECINWTDSCIQFLVFIH